MSIEAPGTRSDDLRTNVFPVPAAKGMLQRDIILREDTRSYILSTRISK